MSTQGQASFGSKALANTVMTVWGSRINAGPALEGLSFSDLVQITAGDKAKSNIMVYGLSGNEYKMLQSW